MQRLVGGAQVARSGRLLAGCRDWLVVHGRPGREGFSLTAERLVGGERSAEGRQILQDLQDGRLIKLVTQAQPAPFQFLAPCAAHQEKSDLIW